ncbi:MAG: mannosyltransferase [Thelocarpon impressellum]|nr:MAG: mannosyltransferase [Thelocarpon impressellum]
MSFLAIALAGLVLGSACFAVFVLLLPSRYHPDEYTLGDPSRPGVRSKTSVQVLVLGDIGRSPRTQYHAISIAKHGGRVDLIGYRESDPHPNLLSDPLVNIIAIPPPPGILRTESRALFLVFGPLKVLWQVWSLWLILGYRTHPARWLLVQNPPSIPTLAIAYAICLLRDTHLLIDWHNFGWSVLALRLGARHPLVRIAKWYEYAFGGLASANFTVTDAMARVLREEHHVRTPILTLHDRPPAQFQPLSATARASFLRRLPETSGQADAILAGRTRLLVSSTSWTADEDFSLLLSALATYSTTGSPPILAIITGKGPQKAHYLAQIAALRSQKQLARATVLTAWLSTPDYAALLGAADLGVSLHTSSSGVDFPMKVVDMFGAGLPVLGWGGYEAWAELVHEGRNGRAFASAAELAAALVELFGKAAEGERELGRLREGAVREGRRRWDDEWGPVAGRVLGLCD